jgi:hypothetical protein
MAFTNIYNEQNKPKYVTQQFGAKIPSWLVPQRAEKWLQTTKSTNPNIRCLEIKSNT